MLPWLAYRGLGALKTTRLRLYGFRTLLSVGAMLSWFSALAAAPIAEVTALSFTAPLFATIGAALILGESVRARRWTATAMGFLGVLIVVRPGLAEISPGAWLALMAALFMGASSLVIKSLSRTEDPNLVVFYMGLFMTPIVLVPALFVWQTPSLELWPWILAMGPVATFGHITLVRAFRAADASAVMPFDFTRLPFAALIGYFAFGEVLDAWGWIGAAVIVGSAVYIARREARLGRFGNAEDDRASALRHQ